MKQMNRICTFIAPNHDNILDLKRWICGFIKILSQTHRAQSKSLE